MVYSRIEVQTGGRALYAITPTSLRWTGDKEQGQNIILMVMINNTYARNM